MAKGGKRPGAGRKKGAKSVLSKAAIEVAKSTGDGVLPHEFLLNIMRNDELPILWRIDCAKAAAPYFAPRLSSIEAKVEAEVQATISSQPLTVEQWEEKYGINPSSVGDLATTGGTTEGAD